jgi:hypothetical protein
LAETVVVEGEKARLPEEGWDVWKDALVEAGGEAVEGLRGETDETGPVA